MHHDVGDCLTQHVDSFQIEALVPTVITANRQPGKGMTLRSCYELACILVL